MRFRTLVIVAASLVAFTATACTNSPNAAPRVDPHGVVIPEETGPAPAHISADYKGPRLHWDDGTNTIPKPANLPQLRQATIEIDTHLAEQGFLRISETVDNENAPTVLVTKWLSSDGDILIDVHSALGVQAITFKRDTGDVMAGILWLRCPVVAKNGDYSPELDFLNQKNAEELTKALCVPVGT